jgi:hypothetical protein
MTQTWNVFDTAFILVTAMYLILRVKGLASGDRALYLASSTPHHDELRLITASASDLGFDILACGACILFPRSSNDLIHFLGALSTAV